MNRVISAIPAMATGMLIQKIQRQSKYVVMNPPSGGPSTGPTSAGIVSQAMALITSALGIVRKTMRRPTGAIIAPPMPCRMRAATSDHNPVDSAQATEPAANTTIAARNTFFAPKRSAIQPDAGMKTARARRYVVNASFKWIGLAARSLAIAGNDVASTVASRFSMNSAVATMSGIDIAAKS